MGKKIGLLSNSLERFSIRCKLREEVQVYFLDKTRWEAGNRATLNPTTPNVVAVTTSIQLFTPKTAFYNDQIP